MPSAKWYITTLSALAALDTLELPPYNAYPWLSVNANPTMIVLTIVTAIALLPSVFLFVRPVSVAVLLHARQSITTPSAVVLKVILETLASNVINWLVAEVTTTVLLKKLVLTDSVLILVVAESEQFAKFVITTQFANVHQAQLAILHPAALPL